MNPPSGTIIVLAIMGLAMFCPAAAARVFIHDGNCIGMVNLYHVLPGESLVEIARNFDLGFNEIADANPFVDPFIPPPGLEIRLPSAWILPSSSAREGIVVNLAEMRLFFFIPGDRGKVMTFPVGIGDMGRDTPLGSFSVIEKLVNPVWHVPPSIRLERPGLGEVVVPGPDNPLGTHALRLSVKDVLIHGTNKPWGQGRRVSHGCIRLYPEDILQLYDSVPVGVKVTIINEPVKIGAKGYRILAEIHRSDGTDYLTEALGLLGKQGLLGRIDLLKLKVAIYRKEGIPVDISR